MGDIDLNISQAIPCALIMNELITNAYKHAFVEQEAGTIEVGVDYPPVSDEVIIQVSDDGIGLPENFLEGTTDSLGVNLIEQLAMQLDGELNANNKEGAAVQLKYARNRKSGSSSHYIRRR